MAADRARAVADGNVAAGSVDPGVSLDAIRLDVAGGGADRDVAFGAVDQHIAAGGLNADRARDDVSRDVTAGGLYRQPAQLTDARHVGRGCLRRASRAGRSLDDEVQAGLAAVRGITGPVHVQLPVVEADLQLVHERVSV